ncbi:copper resistance CopC family protein [Nocardia sp. CNY236]|uniref:copper resistance CopC family protein n=1 Tax=Nocardia sp. CNY236 TaxID=1169152 RepID=UPI000564679E|nr:copper resistance CopC family protein [Nocardia sp. CNY236]
MVVGMLLLGIGTAAAGVASAHSAAIGSVPDDNTTIQAGPARASVTFNEELQVGFPALTVVGPDGNLWSTGDPVVEGNTVSVAVGELGPVGEYTIAYRVTSADGHPISGTRHFTLSEPGNGTPGPKPNAQADGGADGSDGIPLWVFVIAAIVVFGGGLAFALFSGRNRNSKR